jgi:pimeloyl-ACP methyl ester carboxylesterase
MFQSLYSAELIPLLPRAIFDTRDGEYGILTILANGYLQNEEAISAGMYFSVQCGEESAFTNRESAIAAAQADSVLRDYNEYSVKSMFAACDAWHAPPAAARENEAVHSAIPTLVLAGEFDPITPPAWGRLVAESLDNGFFFEFPGLAHGIALSGDCPLGMATGFLNAPDQRPASGCVEEMGGPDWAVY